MSVRFTLFVSLVLSLGGVVAETHAQQFPATDREVQTARTQTLTQIVPGIPIKDHSLMIVVDDLTFEHCNSAIMDYKRALERGGLPTFVLSASWNSPEEVRRKIIEFYTHSHLEGVVLLGDIPVPMIRKSADHKDPDNQEMVPSDRFYDTFDLVFESLNRQADGKYYYRVSAPVAHTRIKSQIYAARIRASDWERDPYPQLNEYLSKVVVAHQEQNFLNQILSYQGNDDDDDEHLAECLAAWLPRTVRMNEHFPGVFPEHGQMRFLRYDFWEDPGPKLAVQLRREALDLAILYGNTGLFGKSDFLTVHRMKLAPTPRLIICKGTPAAEAMPADILYAEGQTVAVYSNPASATSMIGLLGLGARIGQWARHNLTLETQLLGDPAFRFAAPPGATVSLDELLGERLAADDLIKLSRDHPWPDVQNLALTQLSMQAHDVDFSDFLLEKFEQSPFAIVRQTCLQLLSERKDPKLKTVLKSALTDRDEGVRRTAIHEIAALRDPSFAPNLIEAYLENQHAEAMLSVLKKTLERYPPSVLKASAASVFATIDGTDRDKQREEFLQWANR